MKEWIVQNTDITSEEYDKIFSKDKDCSYYHTLPPTSDTDLLLKRLLCFTLKKPNLIHCLKWKIKKEGRIYNLDGITFELLYDILPEEDLFSNKRIGTCHIMSHAIAYNSTCDVITAFCSDFRSGYEDYLHSFAYDSKTNKVLDYTLNIIMNKDDYFKLLNVRPIKVLKNSDLKKNEFIFRKKF